MPDDLPAFYASPTKLGTFLECPRKYWYVYLNPETKSKKQIYPYFTMGDNVHETLKNFFKLSPAIRTKEKLLSMFENFWHRPREFQGGFKDSFDEASYKQRALSMLLNFFEKENILATPIIWYSRTNPNVVITPQLVFSGVFDRIDPLDDGSLHLIDYKTGREDAEDKHNIQLPMYAHMAQEIYKKPVKLASYLNLESGNWDTKELEPNYAQEVIRRVKEVVSRIPLTADLEAFVCPNQSGCNHCDYLKIHGYTLDNLGNIISPLPNQPTSLD